MKWAFGTTLHGLAHKVIHSLRGQAVALTHHRLAAMRRPLSKHGAAL
jgi:hypothetical protein